MQGTGVRRYQTRYYLRKPFRRCGRAARLFQDSNCRPSSVTASFAKTKLTSLLSLNRTIYSAKHNAASRLGRPTLGILASQVERFRSNLIDCNAVKESGNLVLTLWASRITKYDKISATFYGNRYRFRTCFRSAIGRCFASRSRAGFDKPRVFGQAANSVGC